MFHPEVVAEAEHTLIRSVPGIPGGRPVRRSLDECWSMRDQLVSAAPIKKGGPTARPLTEREQTFIAHEILLGRIDYRYWSERWSFITKETQEASPLTPRWASQELFLAHVAQMEYDHHRVGHPDGVLLNILKARQLGISTELEVIMAHGATTQTSLRGLVFADVEEQATYLFGMFEQVVANLPWFLVPPRGPYDTGTFWSSSALMTSVRAAWANASRGGLKDDRKQKGNLGRGKTFGRVHGSELSTMEKPKQIDDGLLPAVPARPRTFVGFESTAKGRYDWWHDHWRATDAGHTRFRNVFIPCYIEPDKYWTVPPTDWSPSAVTLAYAAAVERDSPKWLFGRTFHPTKEHLAWYEHTRASFEAQDSLYKFLEEYPSTPEEAFQHAGRSIFPPSTLERLKSQQRAPAALVLVEPAKDIATLRAWEREFAATQAAREVAESQARAAASGDPL